VRRAGPTTGATDFINPQGVANPDNSKRYRKLFVDWAREQQSNGSGLQGYFYFAAFDEPWKGNGQSLSGQTQAHFGLWTAQASNIVAGAPSGTWTTTATLKSQFKDILIGLGGPPPRRQLQNHR